MEGVFLTETWLADEVDNGEFMDPAFVVYRSDRRFALVGRSIAGGVLSAFTEKLSVAAVDASTLADLVPVIARCKMPFLSVYIVNLYIPPNIGLNDYETFIDALGIFLLDKQYILVGDFNASGFNMPYLDDRRTNSILLLMETLNLRQLNDTTNLNGRLLDLVLTNLNVEFTVAHYLAPFVGDDPHHSALDILINLHLPSDPPNLPSNTNLRYNFRRWMFHVVCAVQIFYNRLYTVLDHCVPKIKSTNPPWFTANVKRLRNMKEYYFKKWKNTRLDHYLNEFRRLRQLLKVEADNAHHHCRGQVEANIKVNPKASGHLLMVGGQLQGSLLFHNDEQLTHQSIETTIAQRLVQAIFIGAIQLNRYAAIEFVGSINVDYRC
ncbi:hypothetical protein Trydic_g4292 [Trypoxylus dichotomus]